MKTSNTKRVWKCPLCGISYIFEGRESVAVCIWAHIFRKDKHFRALSKKIPVSFPPHKKQKK